MSDNSEIEHELFSLNNLHSDVSRSLVAENCDQVKLSANFRALETNADKVFFAYNTLLQCNLLPKLINVEKSDANSEERRKHGNHCYANLKNDFDAFKHYTKSIAYAKSSETLALAYGNRSAVLLKNKLYKECLKDIENAFESGYPEHLQHKLNERKQQAEQQLADSTKQNEDYCTPVPKVTEKENAFLKCAFDNVEMKSNEYMGRHLIASCKIEPGDIIAIEKPYTAILLYEFNLTHCHHCLKGSYNLIQCVQCPLTLYCSTKCREDAWNRYHRFECALLDTLHSIDATKLQLLALRVVICARNEFSAIIREDNYQINPEIYESESYKEIHNLITNEEHRPIYDLYRRSLVAAVLFHLLNCTDFFTEFDGNDSESIKKCTADLLLRHLQTGPSNMHEISEIQGFEKDVYTNREIGCGAYGFMSLLNHSCAPNVVRHCHGTTIVLRALRPIEKGQQLFDNYGYHHALAAKKERKENLKQQYLFDCQCEACTNDFPLYQDLIGEDKNLVLSDEELTALFNGSREMAGNLIPRLIENIKICESFDSKNLLDVLDNQEMLKQCFAILGNKYTVLPF